MGNPDPDVYGRPDDDDPMWDGPGPLHLDPTYIVTSLPPEEFLRQERAFNAAFNPPVEEPPAPATPKPSWWRRLIGAD